MLSHKSALMHCILNLGLYCQYNGFNIESNINKASVECIISTISSLTRVQFFSHPSFEDVPPMLSEDHAGVTMSKKLLIQMPGEKKMTKTTRTKRR